MAEIRIEDWDARSRADFDEAVRLANRFWPTVGEDKALRIEPGPPAHLVFRYRGDDHEVHLERGGVLVALGKLLVEAELVTYWCTIRARPMDTGDPSVSEACRSGLFIHGRTGHRKSVVELTGSLVHELTHKQQEINSLFGWLTFGRSYMLTLGMPYEREAKDLGERATAFAVTNLPGGATVTLSGPATLRRGQQGTYVAAGAPAGGTYRFDPYVGQSNLGIRGVGAGSDRLTVEADWDEGQAFVGVTYRSPAGAEAIDPVTVQLTR